MINIYFDFKNLLLFNAQTYFTDISHYSLIILAIILLPYTCYLLYYQHSFDINLKFNVTNSNLYFKLLYLSPTYIFLILTLNFLSIIYSYIITDLSLLNVVYHSHSDLPLIYKICGTWGNHEGSLFLWIWILSLAVFFYSLEAYKFQFINIYVKVIGILIQILTFFLFFFIMSSNSFLKTTFIFENGVELNPVLQDLILTIHPPLIYLGYIFYVLPFAMVLIYIHPNWSIIKNKINTLIIKKKMPLLFFPNYNLEKMCTIDEINSKLHSTQEYTNLKYNFSTSIHKWIIISWCFLTFGILLGSWWAYFELGWGGWWFWDPVENSSLMPWLLGTSLLHTLKAKFSNILTPWNIFLVLLTFIFCLIATFVVRSGIVESVHSFTEGAGRSLCLIIFIILILCYIIYCFYTKEDNYIIYRSYFMNSSVPLLSHVGLLFIQSSLSLFLLLIIVAGTFYPSIHQYFFNEGITIGSDFYHTFINPLLLSILLLMFVSLLFNSKIRANIYNIIRYLSYIIAVFILSSIQYVFDWHLTLISITYSLLIIYLVKMISLLLKNIKFNLSFYITHLGFLIFLGGTLIYTKFKHDFIAILKLGEKLKVSFFQLIFSNYNLKHSSNYNSFEGNFIFDVNSSYILESNPEKRYYFLQDFYATKPYVLSGLIEDLYLIMGDGNYIEGWDIKIYINPTMSFIWLGGILMVIGGLFAFYSHIKDTQTKIKTN